MVGGQVGDHGDVRAGVHGHQLEGGQLQHRQVVRLDGLDVRQEGTADVAAQMDVIACRFQELGDDGGGGGLAIGAGHGDGLAGADVEEHFHLRGDDCSVGLGLRKGGDVRPDAGGTEDDILSQVVQVACPHVQGGAQRLQLQEQGLIVVGFSFAFIARCDSDSFFQKQLDQRDIAHADADHGHLLAAQGRQVRFKGHRSVPPQAHSWFYYKPVPKVIQSPRLTIPVVIG